MGGENDATVRRDARGEGGTAAGARSGRGAAGGRTVFCRRCRFCTEVCPRGVAIPDVMTMINLSAGLDTDWFMRKLYGDKCGAGPASGCIHCGLCLPRCPQSLPIPDLMDFACERFEGAELAL